MATIVVEDGTGKTNSNSYISAADFETYATDRGVTVSGNSVVLLIQAMDYIEQQPFKGVKGSNEQSLQWPRYDVYIDSYYVSSTTIPQLLKDALCEVALGIDAGNNPLSSVERSTKREKVGDIEVEYMSGSRDQVYLKAAEYKLKKLMSSAASGMNVSVQRG